MYLEPREEAAFDSAFDGRSIGGLYSQPPGPSRMSINNVLPFVNGKMHVKLSELSGKYGDVFQLTVAGKKIVVLNNLGVVWDALVDQDGKFSDRADFDILREAPQRHFLELKSGDSWRRHRDLFVGAMQEYFAGRWGEMESWLHQEADHLSETISRHEGAFDPNRCISLANLSFIQRIIFGRSCTREDERSFNENGLTFLPNGFMNAVRLGLLPRAWRLFFYLSRKHSLDNFKEGITGLSAYIARNVDDHKKSFDECNPRDMCDYLLRGVRQVPLVERDKFQVHEQDVVNGSLTQFAGAGTGVPTFALRWALLYLIRYPEVQETLQQELDAVVDGVPKMSDRSRLPHMQAFINELLRHTSISPMAAVYYATTGDAMIGNYIVEKNTPVIVNYYSVTRDPSVWDEPERFHPERFLDEQGKLRKDLQNKFFPFGLGARRCIGEHLGRMQIFLLCAHLVYRFRFSAAPGEKRAHKIIPGVFLVPESYRMVATPRI
ncbi:MULTISPECIES: cytochrome P450 [unclassified Microbulbifer]|uniref:cytochrome P450 n=1 Tax=unclassified Microbulbifer TaxID=2619833 RepID=UPI0027E4443F|nr:MULTISPECIES: cytochrome P450 [unclassified Microbulbifer]